MGGQKKAKGAEIRPFLLDRGLRKRKILPSSNIPAQVAQLVEHFLGKEEVTGSIPVLGSMLAGPVFF